MLTQIIIILTIFILLYTLVWILYFLQMKKKTYHPKLKQAIESYNNKDYKEALKILEKTNKRFPGVFDIKFWMVRCKDAICDYDTEEEGQIVIDEYLELENLPNKNEQFDIVIATAFAKNGNIIKAEEYGKKYCEKCSNPPITYFRLVSVIHLLRKEYAQAEELVLEGLKKDPTNEELREILSYVNFYKKNT